MAVVVDAIGDVAVSFYRHFDFLPLRQNSRAILLPLKTVAALLA
jgi:hypothetical protein